MDHGVGAPGVGHGVDVVGGWGSADAGRLDGAVFVGCGGGFLDEEGADVVGGVGGVGHGVVVLGIGVAGGTMVVVVGAGDVIRDRDVVCDGERAVGVAVAGNIRSALLDWINRSHFRI